MLNLNCGLSVLTILISLIGFLGAVVDESAIDLSLYKLRPVHKSSLKRCTTCVTDLTEAAKLLTDSLYVLRIKSRCSSFGYLFKLLSEGNQLRHEDITNLAVVTTVEYENYRKLYETTLVQSLKKDFLETIQELERRSEDISEFRNTWRDLIYCLIDDYSSDKDVKAFLLNGKRAKEINTLNEFKSIPTRVVGKGCKPEELAPVGYVKTIVEMIESRRRGVDLDQIVRNDSSSDVLVTEKILDTNSLKEAANSQVQTIIAEIERRIRDKDSGNSAGPTTTGPSDMPEISTVRDLVNVIEERWVGSEQEKTNTKAKLYMEIMKTEEKQPTSAPTEQDQISGKIESSGDENNSNFGRGDRSAVPTFRSVSIKLDEIHPPEPIAVITSDDSDAAADATTVTDTGATIPPLLEDSLLNRLLYVISRSAMQPTRFNMARLSIELLEDWVIAFDDLRYEKFGSISERARTFIEDPENKEMDLSIRDDLAIKKKIDRVLIDMKKTHDNLNDLVDLEALLLELGRLLSFLNKDIDVDDLRRVYNIWLAKYNSYEVTQKFIDGDLDWSMG